MTLAPEIPFHPSATYIARFPVDVQARLNAMRGIILGVAPEAEMAKILDTRFENSGGAGIFFLRLRSANPK